MNMNYFGPKTPATSGGTPMTTGYRRNMPLGEVTYGTPPPAATTSTPTTPAAYTPMLQAGGLQSGMQGGMNPILAAILGKLVPGGMQSLPGMPQQPAPRPAATQTLGLPAGHPALQQPRNHAEYVAMARRGMAGGLPGSW